MGRNRTERNTLNFKKNFFLLLAQQKLTPCEYKCLLVLLEGAEQTKTQIAKILADTPQHVGTAMIHLERLGIIIHTRTEGRNSFFKANLDFVEADDPNQLTIS
jgi:DNA-binding MarR family transcriptional regulator